MTAAGTPISVGQAEQRVPALRLDRDQDARRHFAEERGVRAELVADLDRAPEPVGRMEGAFGRADGQPAFGQVVGRSSQSGFGRLEADFLDGDFPVEVDVGDRIRPPSVDDLEIFRRRRARS